MRVHCSTHAQRTADRLSNARSAKLHPHASEAARFGDGKVASPRGPSHTKPNASRPVTSSLLYIFIHCSQSLFASCSSRSASASASIRPTSITFPLLLCPYRVPPPLPPIIRPHRPTHHHHHTTPCHKTLVPVSIRRENNIVCSAHECHATPCECIRNAARVFEIQFN